MLFPAKMKKVSLIVHQDYVDDVIESLHESGLVEIINIEKEEPSTLQIAEKAEADPEAGVCANYELRLTRLIDILRRVKKTPSGLKALFHPQLPEVKTVESRYLEEIYSYAEGVLHDIEKKILDYEEELKEVDERKEKTEFDLEQMRYLKDFDFDISDIGTGDYVFCQAGKTSDLESLEEELRSFELVELYSKQFGIGKEREWAVVVIAHLSERDKIERICREKITLFDIKHLSGTPKKVIEKLEKERQELQGKKERILSALNEYASKNLPDLFALREEIQVERMRKEVTRNFAKTNTTFIINGWVLERNVDELESLAINVSNDHVVFLSDSVSANPDDPPVYLETPKWAASFKTFLELFATPRYNEINPMIFMGVFFILFFGVMLGDAGYGLMIIFLSLFAYIKFSKFSPMIKNFSFLGIWLGLATTVVGFLTNSFFGDFIPRYIYHNPDQLLYSVTLGGIRLPIEPLRDPLTILTIALVLGLVHLNLGILLAIYQSYRNKEFKSLVTQHLSWVLLEIGGGLLIGYFLLHLWSLSGAIFYAAFALVIVGLVLRLLEAGPLGIFHITGFVGDWLSYARLLALGLATTGMALAFNVIGEIIPQIVPLVGIALVPVILVIAHVANLGIQTLGAGVHSLRLQYVEFFNRFYEGGGKKFQPFSVKRRYTRIKEAEKT
jgi:V/A-type H+-transporting ATPase subunit I